MTVSGDFKDFTGLQRLQQTSKTVQTSKTLPPRHHLLDVAFAPAALPFFGVGVFPFFGRPRFFGLGSVLLPPPASNASNCARSSSMSMSSSSSSSRSSSASTSSASALTTPLAFGVAGGTDPFELPGPLGLLAAFSFEVPALGLLAFSPLSRYSLAQA